VRVRDPGTGLVIGHPWSWSRLPSPDAGVRLVAARGRSASMLVRVGGPLRAPGAPGAPPGVEALARRLGAGTPAAEALARRLIGAGTDVRLLARPRPVEVAGRRGLVFVYTFRDRSGRRGVHAHYLVPTARRTITVVLQALPAERFKRLAPLFERIAGSLELP